MYYPLLRARQFELIALRELSNEGAIEGFVIPILDPVKEACNNLNIAYDVFVEKNQTAYLIVNPSNGEMTGDGNHYLDYLNQKEKGIYLPAFRYRSNAAYILDSIEKYDLKNVLIVCQNDVDSAESDFIELANNKSVVAFNVEDPGRNRTLTRFIKSLKKDFIRLDDMFERQVRNSDFLSIEAHQFSEEHLYYLDEDFSGFSDYTTLASEYIEGGSTPRAVVIHISYLNKQKQIWIRHFTSTTNDSIANVQNKFAEAAQKAVIFCRSEGLSNSAILELCRHFDEEHYPGLGTVKKISIKNHILVVVDYLKSI